MPNPTTDQLDVIANALARAHAYCPADVDDLKQEALWGYCQALKRTPHPHSPFAFARTIMQRAMITYYHKHRWHADHETLSAATPAADNDSVDNRLVLGQYLEALESGCGHTARRIAENLITPTDPDVCRFIIAEMTTTQQQLKRTPQGYAFKEVKQIRISKRQLRQALGVTRSQWTRTLKEVRTFTRSWMALNIPQPKRTTNGADR